MASLDLYLSLGPKSAIPGYINDDNHGTTIQLVQYNIHPFSYKTFENSNRIAIDFHGKSRWVGTQANG